LALYDRQVAEHIAREHGPPDALGPNPSREHVHNALQKIGTAHMAEHAAELLARVPKEEALRIINEEWLPQMNEWIAEQAT
jgi:hypothetical protein